ncbi:MAG: hypothetical protein JW818_23400 [Pirellulales bacterium]|nr:hypothetical protein [Pirellulales bacterium]
MPLYTDPTTTRRPAESRAERPPGIYHADRGHVRTVWWLAAVLAGVALFEAVPALRYLNLATAPGWARIVLLVALLQLGYVAWAAVAPDWSTVWVLMLVFAATATLYAAATALAFATPPETPLPLGLEPIRSYVARWCAAVMLTSTLATYLAGRASTHWRRTVCRLQNTGR